MNEFQYNSTPQEQAMQDLLKTQSHRLARQQIIFALIFLLVIVLAAYYIVTRMIWAIYDGYITIDENHISAVDDIYILKVNKEVGEVVHKGDTLYSYVLLGNIVNQYDPNIIPSAVKETHDMEVQAKLAREEIPVLRTRLAELRKQKASETSDIYYGLTDNTKRNALDAEIAEVEEELKKQLHGTKRSGHQQCRHALLQQQQPLQPGTHPLLLRPCRRLHIENQRERQDSGVQERRGDVYPAYRLCSVPPRYHHLRA